MRFGTDRRDTAGMTPAELADEMEWRALEDAAAARGYFTGLSSTVYSWPLSQRPGYKATPALDKITPAERKVLDARPLIFGCGHEVWPAPRPRDADGRGASHLFTVAEFEKHRKAAQREYALSQTIAPKEAPAWARHMVEVAP